MIDLKRIWHRSATGRARAATHLALAGAAALLAFPPAAATAQTATFPKNMDLIVGMPPGGGEDLYSRLVQHHLARFLPGSPNVVVQNMPGAGSLRSVINVSHQPADGSTIGMYSSSLLIEAIAEPEHTQVDLRNFAYLGNVSEDIRVCYVRSATGVKTIDDIRKNEKQIIFGATAKGTSGNVDAAIMRKLFGVNIKQVDGYAGSADKRLAVDKGEIDGDCGGFTSVPKEWLRDGTINIVVRMSPTLIDGLDPKVPYGRDLLPDDGDKKIYDFLTSPERLGRMFMVSTKVAPEKIAALRDAFDKMMADATFLADAAKAGMTVIPMKGADVDKRIAELYQTPPDLIARAAKITGN